MNQEKICFDFKTFLALVLLAASLVSLYFSAVSLSVNVSKTLIPFDTDEADHANAGLELFMASRQKNAALIASAITRQAFYPPIHSFSVAASYALFGVGVAQSRVPSVAFFGLSSLLLGLTAFHAARILDFKRSSQVICAAAAILFITSSTIIAENAALCMLELCGVFFTVLTLYFAATSQVAPLVSTLSSFVVMLTKYSFGIIVLPGVVFGGLFNDSTPYISQKSVLRVVILALLFAACFAAWCLISDSSSVFHFFVGHPTYAPLLSAENLLFDIRAWIYEYSDNPISSLLIIISAIYASINLWHVYVVRVSVGIALSALCILGLSTTNESRHFIVAAPALWMLGALGIGCLANKAQSHISHLAILVFIAPCLYANFTLHNSLSHRVIQQMEGKPEFNELHDALFTIVDCTQPVLFIGVSDQFGIEALRWKGAATCSMPYTQIRFDTYPYRDDKNRTALRRKRNLDKPYSDTQFPKDPFQSILDQNYYRAIVLIRDIGARGANPTLVKNLKELFIDAKQVQFSKGGKEITVVLF